MAGRKALTIDEKIRAAEDTVVSTKEKYDDAVKKLEELMKKKKAVQNEELLRLFGESPKTYEEIVAFLREGMTEEEIKKAARKKPGRKPKNAE